MKKLLLLPLLFLSCTPEQAPTETCTCENAKYYENAPVGCIVYRTIEINCITRQPIELLPNSTFVKCEDE
jgi:hypothetical protein